MHALLRYSGVKIYTPPVVFEKTDEKRTKLCAWLNSFNDASFSVPFPLTLSQVSAATTAIITFPPLRSVN